MKYLFLLALFLSAVPSFAQKREIVELQRDMATLQDQVRTMQRTLDEKLATITVLVQQALDSSNKSNTAVAVSERGVGERFDKLERGLLAPVANVSSKMDQLTGEFQAVRTDMADLTTRLDKLQAQMTDLKTMQSTMQERPAPPPAGGFAPQSSAAPAGPPPGMTAESLYSTAFRDRSAGNLDLAMSQFTDYLRFYGDTNLAPNAQFYIGEISYNKNDMESAVRAFDQVLEKYPENNKTPDAMYMKGKALAKGGQRTQAAEEFRQLLKRYPRSELASKATAELKTLGLSASTGTPAAAPVRRRR